MKLAYQAFDRSGRAVTDVIDAADMNDAAEKLRRQGLFISRINPVTNDAEDDAHLTSRRAGKGSKLKNLAIFTRQFYVLVSTGTPITQALHSLSKQMKDPRWRAVIREACDSVEQGQTLAEALGQHPEYFDAVYCSLIAAGESSGKLPAMLDRLASLTRQQLHVRNTVRGAMVYPVLLVSVSVIVLVLMLLVVLPRFTELFESLDVPLPPTTVMLVALSDGLRAAWWAALLVVIGGVVGLRMWLRTPQGKHAWDTIMLRLPQIGKATRNFATARIARLLGILIESHLPLLEVLTLVQNTVSNGYYRDLMQRAEEAVTRGDAISSAFNDPNLIEPSVYEAMRSGEQAGKVGFVLLAVADFMDEENELLVRSLLSILEPMILIVLGLLVGFVAVSMFMPLFDLTSMTAGGN